MNASIFKTVTFTSVALLAFAGNSVLCRLALGDAVIDAASFTAIRLLSGIVVLMALLLVTKNDKKPVSKGSWFAAILLFVYAITFSFAYISLDTGTGALILFGSVQLTMIITSLALGHKLHYSEWLGVLIAFLGFFYLVKPSLSTPSFTGFVLMVMSGIAWGGYTLKGRGSINPISDTRYNFLRTLPFVFLLIILSLQDIHLSSSGVILAILSGAIASGIGYAIWYIALRGLTVIQASVVQLLVPIIAALGGILLVNEMITLRLALSTLMVLGGILIVIIGRYYFTQLSNDKNKV